MKPSRGWAVALGWTALLGAAALTSWLLLRSHGGAPAAGTAAKEQPDYLLDQAALTRFAPDGARRYVIRATRVAHFASNGVALLARVDMKYFPASGAAWHLQADKGRLHGQGRLLDLAGNVRARELEVADPLRFLAPAVTVVLPSERIRSSARVVLRQGHRESRGTGLEADLQTGTLSLLKDVTSRYVP